jgi:hypothetical protein
MFAVPRPLGMPPPATHGGQNDAGEGRVLGHGDQGCPMAAFNPVELGLPDRLPGSLAGKLTHGFLRSFDARFLSLVAIEIKVATGGHGCSMSSIPVSMNRRLDRTDRHADVSGHDR